MISFIFAFKYNTSRTLKVSASEDRSGEEKRRKSKGKNARFLDNFTILASFGEKRLLYLACEGSSPGC